MEHPENSAEFAGLQVNSGVEQQSIINPYLKRTDAVAALLRSIDLRQPYDGAKDYFYIADVDDCDYLSALVAATCRALPEPKLKKNRSH